MKLANVYTQLPPSEMVTYDKATIIFLEIRQRYTYISRQDLSHELGYVTSILMYLVYRGDKAPVHSAHVPPHQFEIRECGRKTCSSLLESTVAVYELICVYIYIFKSRGIRGWITLLFLMTPTCSAWTQVCNVLNRPN